MSNNRHNGPQTIFAYHLHEYADRRGVIRTSWEELLVNLGHVNAVSATVSCVAGCGEDDPACRVEHGLAVHEALSYLKLGWGFHFRYIDDDRGGWEGKW